jgi:hypothetical protein
MYIPCIQLTKDVEQVGVLVNSVSKHMTREINNFIKGKVVPVLN